MNRTDESQENIALLPDSAFQSKKKGNTGQKVRQNEAYGDSNNGNDLKQAAQDSLPTEHNEMSTQQYINFYDQKRQDTDQSSIAAGTHAQVVFDKFKSGDDSANTNGKNDKAMKEAMRREVAEMQGQEDDDPRSRNILNGGRQLSLITQCSDILDSPADLVCDYLRDDSDNSKKDDEDEYLTF